MGPAPSCPEGMIAIGATSFHVGTDREQSYYVGSRPVREVDVDAFCIDETEVTVAAYKRCVDAGKCVAPHANSPEYEWVSEACNQLLDDRMSHPVNCIGRDESSAFCSWAGKRLPTHNEWLLAAGRLDGRTYPWGNEPPGATTANLFGADDIIPEQTIFQPIYKENDGWRNTSTVRAFIRDRSPLGAFDMGGNVNEWTSSEIHGRTQIQGGSYANAERWNAELRLTIGVPHSDRSPSLGIRCVK